ncbi:hypothetical protein V6N13_098673 [Hibiscus sabdariffa]|uniref:Uncharacterized protein n=1 Tax=Hibiscus sabdariffa TaxID=183260 RepID=A0ABR2EEZ8_9ROSI
MVVRKFENEGSTGTHGAVDDSVGAWLGYSMVKMGVGVRSLLGRWMSVGAFNETRVRAWWRCRLRREGSEGRGSDVDDVKMKASMVVKNGGKDGKIEDGDEDWELGSEGNGCRT